MNKRLISIIIPIYNVAPYIETLLNSIISQTIFEDLEIIMVDDGSTDGSEEICRKYVHKYSNFQLVTQENAGVSAARNKGLALATGDYISFCDSDDWLSPFFYERLRTNIEEENADIAMVDFSFAYNHGHKKKRDSLFMTWTGNDYIMRQFLSGNVIANNIVDKLFRRNVILDNQFKSGYRIGEDMFFLFSVLKKVEKISIDTRESLYFYRVRTESAMTSTFSDKYFDTIILSEKMYYECMGTHLEGVAHAHLIHEKCKVVEYMLLNHANSSYNDKKNELLSDIKQYSLCDAYRYLTKRQFLGLFLMKLNPKIYIQIFKWVQNVK